MTALPARLGPGPERALGLALRASARTLGAQALNVYAGWVYVALVIDVFSRFIVGWQASTSLRSGLALTRSRWRSGNAADALDKLVHHSDHGVQYLSIRYTERSVGWERRCWRGRTAAWRELGGSVARTFGAWP